MPAIGLEISLILVLILANGIFAMAEMAVISARKLRLQQRAEGGDEGARAALALAESPNRFLSTVQIGITLIGILAGTLGGAELGAPLTVWIAKSPLLAPFANELAVLLIVSAITFASLILGELVPKRLALADPEGIAARVARPMRWLVKIGGPLSAVLDLSTNLVVRLLRVKPAIEPPITEEEFKVLLQQGTEVGVFAEAETTMVEGVLRLGDRLVGALMTPRTDIHWLDPDDPAEVNLRVITNSPYSYYPLARGSLDNILGIVRAKDILAAGPELGRDWSEYIFPAVYLPESTFALAALEKLRAAPGNLAMVIDEFGGVLGMVTLFDAIEAVIGAISQEGKAPAPLATQREDGSWLVDGAMPVDQFKELFDLDILPDETRVGFQTVAGFLLALFGEIPAAGQHGVYGKLRFEVVDMDNLRVDKVLVQHDPD